MKKVLSLVKASLSQDMNFFNYSVKSNSGKLKKIIFPIILFILVAFSIGSYAFMMAKALHKVYLTYIVLTLFLFLVVILNFIQGIYKSQGILFEAKDNDLLFSLPIDKSYILFVRIFKLMLFQFLYNLMFLVPAIFCYCYFETPSLGFYFLTLLIMILIPIIPTILSSFLGYIVKLVSSRFKSKKIIQTILSFFIFFGIYLLTMKMDTFVSQLASTAKNLNEIISKIYYPIGTYISLINEFNFWKLYWLFIINILVLTLFIWLGSRYYFRIIMNSKDIKKERVKDAKFVKRKPIVSLLIKELKRFLSSPVYMFNTSFGLFLILIVSIILCIKGPSILANVLKQYGISKSFSIPVLFYLLVLFSGFLTSITSSSISLEGKTINITKSLPIKEIDIMNSKILLCMVLELPFLILADLIFFIRFKPSMFYVISIFLVEIVVILLSGVIGLLINLNYPKMNASNDTEVVKQSMSTTLSVFIGIGLFILSVLGFVFLTDYISVEKFIVLHISILFLIFSVLYFLLKRFGLIKYRNINI